MKKWLVAFIFALVAFALVACGTTDDTPTETEMPYCHHPTPGSLSSRWGGARGEGVFSCAWAALNTK